MISKCRKWHLRATYRKFFPGGVCPQITVEAHGSGYAAPKTSLFLVDGVGISDLGVSCLCCKLYRGIFFLSVAYYSIINACLNLCFIIGGLY